MIKDSNLIKKFEDILLGMKGDSLIIRPYVEIADVVSKPTS